MSGLVVVTGATGFIGWHVAERFLAGGRTVRAIVRPTSDRPVPRGIERISAPLREPDLVSACRGADVIVHMAALTGIRSAAEFHESNVVTTVEVARAARALGVRLVHMSSLGATGPGDPRNPPTEDSPLRPVNKYGESKREAEAIVTSIDGLAWTILRPSLVYGPRDRNFFPMFRLGRLGIFPVPAGGAAFNVIHVHDVARAVETATLSDAALHNIFFVGHPHHVTLEELMRTVASVFGKRFRPLPVPRAVLRVAADVGSIARALGIRVPIDRARWKEFSSPGFVCRIDKARDRLGFVATTNLPEGLRMTADWYRQHQLL